LDVNFITGIMENLNRITKQFKNLNKNNQSKIKFLEKEIVNIDLEIANIIEKVDTVCSSIEKVVKELLNDFNIKSHEKF
jgi:hypothetical protein